MMLKIRSHHDHFSGRLLIGSHTKQTLTVGFIHTHNQVKTLEVRSPDGTGTMSQTITMRGCVAAHSLIGELSLVVVDKSGRIDNEITATTCTGSQRTEDFFCSTRTAYIAKTNEKD